MSETSEAVKEYTLEEVQKHTSSSDCWLIIGNASNGKEQVVHCSFGIRNSSRHKDPFQKKNTSASYFYEGMESLDRIYMILVYNASDADIRICDLTNSFVLFSHLFLKIGCILHDNLQQ